eukprot:m.914384 g.914384  ORF g.914384 m.914384 type:complete len:139 (-) comp23730_c0_seq17:1091-1507(-)
MKIQSSPAVTFSSTGLQNNTVCGEPCLFILAFRPLALAYVYFCDTDSRAELLNGRKLLRKVRQRISRMCGGQCMVKQKSLRQVRFKPVEEVEEVLYVPTQYRSALTGSGTTMKLPDLDKYIYAHEQHLFMYFCIYLKC